MSFGKVVRLFLVDGTPSGMRIGEILNWSGIALAAYRTDLTPLLEREEISQPGVYFLLGTNDDGQTTVYIGETEDLQQRIKQHIEKEFWNQVICFSSTNRLLNKAHVKWLEESIYSILKKGSTVELKNGNIPPGAKLSEADIAMMQEFRENIFIILGSLGFMGINEAREGKLEKKAQILYLKRKDYEATMRTTTTEFIVPANTVLMDDDPKYITDIHTSGIYKKRQIALSENLIQKTAKGLILTQDMAFKSPSAAAMFLLGKPANGRDIWKDENGKSFGEIELSKSEKKG